MGSIVESFCATFAIEENQSLKKDEHYQLSGSKITITQKRFPVSSLIMKYLSMKVKMFSMC